MRHESWLPFEPSPSGYQRRVAIGGFFLLVVIIVAVVVLGGALYATAAHKRARQLSPEGGTIDAKRPEDEAGAKRPEHVEVDTEQQTRFIGTR